MRPSCFKQGAGGQVLGWTATVCESEETQRPWPSAASFCQLMPSSVSLQCSVNAYMSLSLADDAFLVARSRMSRYLCGQAHRPRQSSVPVLLLCKQTRRMHGAAKGI